MTWRPPVLGSLALDRCGADYGKAHGEASGAVMLFQGQAVGTRPQLARDWFPAHHQHHKKTQGSTTMSGFSRRDFLSLTGSAAVAAMSGAAHAAMGPNDKFD